MPEVDLIVIGQKTEPRVFEYTWKDAVLYASGVFAGSKSGYEQWSGIPALYQ